MTGAILLGVVVVLLLAGLGVLFYLSQKQSQSGIQTHLKVLQENFANFQQTLFISQKEFERSQETRQASLRQELSQELQSNRKELQLGLGQSSQALEQKMVSLDNKLEGKFKELTSGVSGRLEENIKEGFKHFEKVQEHLRKAEIQLLNLNTVGQSIHELNDLLKLPHLRGGFGEASLERLLSDLLPKESFELQYKIGPESTERVDAVVKYPSHVLPIDSKFPREQVLALFETGDPEKLEAARKTLSEAVRVLAKQIKEKYIRPDLGTTDMALLFVPSETLYFEIIRHPKLYDELMRHKVFAVSPNTLAITLHGISLARNYYDMAKGVEETLLEMRKARTHFENYEKKVDDVGVALNRAQNAYQTANTHLSRYRSAVGRLIGEEEKTLPVVPVAPEQVKLIDS
jgi:DNA recombination protein RmuC